MSAHCSVAFLRSLLSETVLVHRGKLKALNFAENHACPRVVKGIGSAVRCFQTFTAHLRNSSEKDTHGVAAEKRLLPSSGVLLLVLCLACVGCPGATGLLPQSGFVAALWQLLVFQCNGTAASECFRATSARSRHNVFRACSCFAWPNCCSNALFGLVSLH